jgi:hypothetical protein
MGICALISSISILEDAFFSRSCAYNVQRLLLLLILSYSILPFSGFKLCPSCVRAPCRTSELRVVRYPLVQTLALTLIKIARVVVTVRAYLSDFPDFHRMLLHLTLYAVASHKALASRILGAHRSRVVPSVPGSRSSETFSRTPMSVYVLLSTSRDIRNSIFVANPGHKSLISKFGNSYHTP